jgi:hypothetical protein
VFGEAASLSPFFMSNVLSTKIRNTLHASITEFILSHEGQAELILSKKLFGDRQDGGHHPLVIETTKIVSNNNLWSIEPRYSDVGFTTLKKAAYRTISSHGSTEVRQKITIQQNALFATIEYTPGEIIADFAAATISSEPTYLTVQVGTGKHITLMPEYLQYINHSCDPNVFFNTTKMQLIALKEILPDEEMTFFYPASEWKMTQPFNCYCGSKYCIGEIKGAAFLSRSEREKYRFTDFILQQFSKRANFSEKYGAA